MKQCAHCHGANRLVQFSLATMRKRMNWVSLICYYRHSCQDSWSVIKYSWYTYDPIDQGISNTSTISEMECPVWYPLCPVQSLIIHIIKCKSTTDIGFGISRSYQEMVVQPTIIITFIYCYYMTFGTSV